MIVMNDAQGIRRHTGAKLVNDLEDNLRSFLESFRVLSLWSVRKN
ncbi:hypothetical protein ABES08_00070 [Peribacillus simplex]|nr:hypothetical protein [Peribacillus simplex]